MKKQTKKIVSWIIIGSFFITLPMAFILQLWLFKLWDLKLISDAGVALTMILYGIIIIGISAFFLGRLVKRKK